MQNDTRASQQNRGNAPQSATDLFPVSPPLPDSTSTEIIHQSPLEQAQATALVTALKKKKPAEVQQMNRKILIELATQETLAKCKKPGQSSKTRGKNAHIIHQSRYPATNDVPPLAPPAQDTRLTAFEPHLLDALTCWTKADTSTVNRAIRWLILVFSTGKQQLVHIDSQLKDGRPLATTQNICLNHTRKQGHRAPEDTSTTPVKKHHRASSLNIQLMDSRPQPKKEGTLMALINPTIEKPN